MPGLILLNASMTICLKFFRTLATVCTTFSNIFVVDRLLSMHDKFSIQICELIEKIDNNSLLVQKEYSELLFCINPNEVLK